MTNAERIRKMTDDELVDLLEWGLIGNDTVPNCDEDCKDYCEFCENGCPPHIRERAVREWLKKEVAG